MDISQYRDAFRQEVSQSIPRARASLAILAGSNPTSAALDDLKRFFHTLASAAGLMQFDDVSRRCREYEEHCRVLQEQADLPGAQECAAWMKELESMEKELLRP